MLENKNLFHDDQMNHNQRTYCRAVQRAKHTFGLVSSCKILLTLHKVLYFKVVAETKKFMFNIGDYRISIIMTFIHTVLTLGKIISVKEYGTGNLYSVY